MKSGTQKRSDETGTRGRRRKRERRERVGNFLNKKKKKQKQIVFLIWQRLKRKRGELKRRRESVVVKVLWVKKKKKRGKKRDFDGRRFTVRKQPFLPPFYSFLWSVYPTSGVIICPIIYLKLFVENCSVVC